VLVAPSGVPKLGELVAVRDGDTIAVRPFDGDGLAPVGTVAGIFRPFVENAPVAMLPMSDAQAAAPVS